MIFFLEKNGFVKMLKNELVTFQRFANNFTDKSVITFLHKLKNKILISLFY